MHSQASTEERKVRSWAFRIVRIAAPAVVLLALASQASRAVSKNVAASNVGTILPAHIRPARIFSVSRNFPAVVQSVSISPGAVVRTGDELAILESSDSAMTLERAKARVELADRRVGVAIMGKGSAQGEIYAEQLLAAKRAVELAKARIDQFSLAQFQQMYSSSLDKTKNLEDLVSQQLATSAELARSQKETRDARIALEDGVEHQSRLQQELDSAESQRKLIQMQLAQNKKAEAESTRTQVETARLEYHEALLDLQQLQDRSSELSVTADQSGTVLSAVHPGDRLLAGGTLVQLADLSQLRVEVPVAGKIARQLRAGDPVTVRLPLDLPREISALVSDVLLVPEENAQSYVVRIMIPNPDPSVILVGLEGAVVFPHVKKETFSWPTLPF